MSIVKYNDITLPYADTTRFDQEAVYDDEGQTDYVATKFSINVQCLINAEYLTMVAPDLLVIPATSPSTIMRAIRSRLLTPRKTLSFTFNGFELIPQAQVGNLGTVDAMNGPKPIYCNITEITNSTYLVEYGIEAHYWENHDTEPLPGQNEDQILLNSPGATALFNRWSETVNIDDCGFSVLVRTGRYRIRSDNVSGLIADKIRSQLAVTSIADGFVRDSSRYTINPDGLLLEYQIVDREVWRKPPSPSFTAAGSYTESVVPGRGTVAILRKADVSVSLKGSFDTPQNDMVIAAIRIGMDKLRRNNGGVQFEQPVNPVTPVTQPVAILEGASVTTGLFENTIDFRMRMMIGVRQERVGTLPFALMDTDIDTGTDQDIDGRDIYVPPYLDRGSASILLQAAAYYNPSIIGDVLQIDQRTDEANNPSTETGTTKVNMAGANPGTAGALPEGV